MTNYKVVELSVQKVRELAQKGFSEISIATLVTNDMDVTNVASYVSGLFWNLLVNNNILVWSQYI